MDCSQRVVAWSASSGDLHARQLPLTLVVVTRRSVRSIPSTSARRRRRDVDLAAEDREHPGAPFTSRLSHLPDDGRTFSSSSHAPERGQAVRDGLLAFSPQDAGPRSGLIGASTDSTRRLPGRHGDGCGVAPDSITLARIPVALDFGQVEILVSTVDSAADQHWTDPPRSAAPDHGAGQTAMRALEAELASAPLSLAAGASVNVGVTFTPLVTDPSRVLQIQHASSARRSRFR